jgi:hypothetical protein
MNVVYIIILSNFVQNRFNIIPILSFYLRLLLPIGLLPSDIFGIKISFKFSFFPFSLYPLPTLNILH